MRNPRTELLHHKSVSRNVIYSTRRTNYHLQWGQVMKVLITSGAVALNVCNCALLCNLYIRSIANFLILVSLFFVSTPQTHPFKYHQKISQWITNRKTEWYAFWIQICAAYFSILCWNGSCKQSLGILIWKLTQVPQ